MLRVAFLGASFVGQLSRNKPDDVEVVWAGVDPARFAAEVPPRAPDVVVLDLSAFSDDADDRVRALIASCRAELSIVTYSFARRALLRSLQGPQLRVLQAPVTLDVLQAHFAPFQIRRVLESTRKEVFAMESSAVSAPRYTREQLGKLMQISSSVQCECPNNLAQVVEKLLGFEEYSKQCESRNEADRAVHSMLYRSTAAARAEMEKALTQLIEHEKLQL
ncbi:MAG: hypothetical protein ACOZQL_19830 [Myxococcota bacterium]